MVMTVKIMQMRWVMVWEFYFPCSDAKLMITRIMQTSCPLFDFSLIHWGIKNSSSSGWATKTAVYPNANKTLSV
jgi:hypothetical protein